MAGFHEPQNETDVAGQLHYRQVTNPYEKFMEEEGIPIYRNSIGAYDVRDLPLGPWKRLGGRGTFIYLLGTTGRGMYVIEVPAAGASNSERHIYEEMFYVVEGRGTTEVWREPGKMQAFEWQSGSLFSIPINTSHRLVNATSSPALLVGVSSAPTVMNQFNNRPFVFENGFNFTERYYDGDEKYFKPNLELVPDPITGRAVVQSNVIPDIAGCELPLDNQRSPGYRRIQPQMVANQALGCFVGQHAQGRYAKAHRGESAAGTAAVLICLRGKGYTFTWPNELGIHPWQDGHGDKVLRQDYIAGGMVCSSPIGPGYFHAHYGVGKEPMRFLALLGPNLSGNPGRRGGGGEGQKMTVSPNADIRDGGLTIGYDIEDPFVRKTFEVELSKAGIECGMVDSLYQPRQG